jgi:Tat protein translocase TatB subunit
VYLFIFESIGTSELILVGIVALVFLGPRRLPEIARKAGKIMSEFRGTAQEFKQTWEREVDIEKEVKSFDLDEIEAEAAQPIPRGTSISTDEMDATPDPMIKDIDPAEFERIKNEAQASDESSREPTTPSTPENDKRNWL